MKDFFTRSVRGGEDNIWGLDTGLGEVRNMHLIAAEATSRHKPCVVVLYLPDRRCGGVCKCYTYRVVTKLWRSAEVITSVLEPV